MKINFTKKQYDNLITMSQLSGYVLGILGDSYCGDEVDYKKLSNEHEELEKYILSFADDFGVGDKIDSYGDDIFLSDDESEKYYEIMSDYDDYAFWSELENRLARRDFSRTITEAEKKEAVKTGWLPNRFREIEKKYEEEFEENGLENIEIKKK